VPEIEVPTEHLHETIHEHAHGHATPDRFTRVVALTAALLAVFAAIAALLAGHHANETLLEEMKSTNQWSYFQAKSIKQYLFEHRRDLLAALNRAPPASDEAKIAEYRKEKAEIEQVARSREKAARRHLTQHNVLARSVTLFLVAIALAAIAVLTRRKPLFWAGLAFSAGGLFFFVQGLVT
jgi:hypothetical protein